MSIPAEDDLAVDEDPGRQPPRGKGAIWGVVTDTALNEPLIEVMVSVVGSDQQALTDLNGQYRFELKPGEYTFRFLYELHRPARLERVVVRAGKVYRRDIRLEPEQNAFDVIAVEADLEKASVEAQMLTRQRSTAVADSVGRADISKSAAGDAAQAAKRVVGANIEGGRFVYVRGLGERYTNGLLNGSPLPSPEPDRAAVPLDMFPSLVVESLNVSKTFTPDMPADFAGGSINVQTRDIPDKPLLNVSASVGYDTSATFQKRLSHRGSSTDWLGFDSGMRALPGDIPQNYKLDTGIPKPNGETITLDELTPYGRSMNTFMTTTETHTPPNHGASIVAGRGWDLGGERRLGVLGSVNYSRSFDIQEGVERTFQMSRTGLEPFVDYARTSGYDKVRWGAFGSVTYELTRDHRLKLIGLHSQLSDSETHVYEGPNDYTNATYHSERLMFVSRALDFGKLSGEHEFDALAGGTLDWNVSLSSAQRDEPDTRDTVYQFNTTRNAWTYLDGSNSGRHFFSTQDEVARGGGIDWTQPLSRSEQGTKIKLGGATLIKDRAFRARRFAFRKMRGSTSADPAFFCDGDAFDPTCPDQLFVDQNIGTLIYLQEGTRPSDAYDAGLDVYAAYTMAEVALWPELKIVLGERVEVTRQTVDPVDQLNTGGLETAQRAHLADTSLLPSVSVLYSATPSSKLRASVSRTLARPQLRELAPFAYSNYFGGRLESGNPDLSLTHITNADVRFEHFPTLREVFAMTVFLKNFEDPIERVLVPTGQAPTVSYRNSPSATLIGIELEARKSLESLDSTLRDFTGIANLTLSRSRVSVDQTGSDTEGRGFMTNVSRPMMLQAPWVLNLALDYANEEIGFGTRVLYNVAGPRISDVGTDGVDDEYVQPRHVIDLVVTKDFGQALKTRLTVSDILSTDHVTTVGSSSDGAVSSRYSEGTSIALSAGYDF